MESEVSPLQKTPAIQGNPISTSYMLHHGSRSYQEPLWSVHGVLHWRAKFYLLHLANSCVLRRVTHSWFFILYLLLPMLYFISLLMQPTRIGRSIRNLRGHLSNSATRLRFYFYLVAWFLPSCYLYFLLWVSLYRSVLVLSPAHF